MTTLLPDEAYATALDITQYAEVSDINDGWHLAQLEEDHYHDTTWCPESTSWDEPNDCDEDWMPGGSHYEYFYGPRLETPDYDQQAPF